MKRYRFRLESVLRVRRLQEDVARAELARATAIVAAAQQALLIGRDQLRRLAAEPCPPDPAAWEAQRRILLSAADEIEVLVSGVALAVAERESRQAALAGARTRVRALERLDERRRAEHELEAGRQAEKVVDDLVTTRFRAAGSGDS
jgi:flagellar export protein FliJ